jgi:hypothetical protein
MAAYLRPGAGGKVRIELFGEDGRALLRLVQVYYAAPNARVHIYEDLAYEISAAAELGRLVITTEDGFGRPVAVNSVDLVLLGMGEADPNPSGEEQQAIVIRKPAMGALIQGGTLVLSGEARPVDSGLLRVELVSEEGKVVGQRAATVGEPGPNGYGAFQVEVPYQVDSFTRARLVISAGGAPMSEIRWLASVEVLLGP